MMNCAKRHKA